MRHPLAPWAGAPCPDRTPRHTHGTLLTCQRVKGRQTLLPLGPGVRAVAERPVSRSAASEQAVACGSPEGGSGWKWPSVSSTQAPDTGGART